MNNAIFMYGLNDPDNAATVQIKIIEKFKVYKNLRFSF